MSENAKPAATLSGGQMAFLFILIIVVLVLSFSAGVYIGQNSSGGAKAAVTSAISATVNEAAAEMKTATVAFKAPEQSKPEQIKQEQMPTVVAPPTTPIAISGSEYRFVVQVATFATSYEGEGLLTQIRRDGFAQSYLRSPQPNSVNQIYSLEIGPFKEKSAADAVRAQLLAKGLQHARVSLGLAAKS